ILQTPRRQRSSECHECGISQAAPPNAAPGRRTSMADNNRGVSVVSLPPPPSPPPPPPPPSLPSPPLLAIVLALRTRRAVVSVRSISSAVATHVVPLPRKSFPCLMFLLPPV
ncbi:hypothetical protein ALC57_12311, partial [Trachymyrmex cornetzi]